MRIKVYTYNSRGGHKFFFYMDLPDDATDRQVNRAIKREVKAYNRTLTQKIKEWRVDDKGTDERGE